ncbi:MAG: hypothetical protein H7Y61_08510, partial [Rhizobiales bacterium]|nr:hypothetical protein [Rhizobacter sp.]
MSAPAVSPAPRRRGGLRVALVLALAMFALVVGLAAGGWWAVRSEQGSAW